MVKNSGRKFWLFKLHPVSKTQKTNNEWMMDVSQKFSKKFLIFIYNFYEK